MIGLSWRTHFRDKMYDFYEYICFFLHGHQSFELQLETDTFELTHHVWMFPISIIAIG